MSKIKTYLKFSVHIFTLRLMGNLVLSLQMSLSMILCCIMIGNILDMTKSQRWFSSMSDLNGYYFSLPANLSKEDTVQFLDGLNGIKGLKSVGTFNQISNQPIFAYNKSFAEIYKQDISEGVWIDHADLSKNYIPLVVNKLPSGLKLGSVFGVSGITYKIIGILKDPVYWSFSMFGSSTNTVDLMSENKSSFFGLTLSESLSYYSQNNTSIPIFQYKNMVAIFQNKQDMDNARSYISRYGNMHTFSEIASNGNYVKKEYLHLYTPFFIIIFLLSVIGLIGISSLSAIQNIRMFAVLTLVGAKTRDIFNIIFSYYLISIIVAFGLFSCMLMLYTKFIMPLTFAMPSLFALLTISALALLGSIVPCIVLKLNPPFVSYMREVNEND
jgi:ABC-type antimicrobial peptide transport system permease subunit